MTTSKIADEMNAIGELTGKIMSDLGTKLAVEQAVSSLLISQWRRAESSVRQQEVGGRYVN